MKKIWMIEQQSRVKGTEENWSQPIPVYAYTNKESAVNDIKYNCNANDGYLEYKYLITEYILYDE